MDERSNDVKRSSAAKVFLLRPDRVAAAWRRIQAAERGGASPRFNLLDGVVESFIREVGRLLSGELGSPWARCQGLLRLSSERGVSGLYAEFSTLRACLIDALEVLGSGVHERRLVHAAIDEALDSAVACHEQLRDPAAPPPVTPFGGVVLEVFETRLKRPREPAPSVHPTALH